MKLMISTLQTRKKVNLKTLFTSTLARNSGNCSLIGCAMTAW